MSEKIQTLADKTGTQVHWKDAAQSKVQISADMLTMDNTNKSLVN